MFHSGGVLHEKPSGHDKSQRVFEKHLYCTTGRDDSDAHAHLMTFFGAGL